MVAMRSVWDPGMPGRLIFEGFDRQERDRKCEVHARYHLCSKPQVCQIPGNTLKAVALSLDRETQ
jgi:hypothetical protein